MICSVQPKTAGGMVFPCRQCLPCRINDSRKWAARCLLEHADSFNRTGYSGGFITLTYAPEFLPADGVRVLDLQKFMRACRKSWKEECDGQMWRYLGVGEYGELSGRAHYHALIFGVDIRWLAEAIPKHWKYGFAHVGSISPASVAYVAAYCLKAPKGQSSWPDGTNRPFRVMSRRPGIGGNASVHVANQLVSSWEGALDDLDENGIPRELRMVKEKGGYELLPLDSYMRNKLEKEVGLDNRWNERVRRQYKAAYSSPVLTEAEKVERRKAAQAAGLAKYYRMKRKAKV